MMVFPVDTPLGMGALLPAMNRFPFQELFFQDLFWSGLALLLCNGVCNLIAVVFFIQKKHAAFTMGLFAGILMVIWCIAELIYLPNFLAVFYLFLGIAQLALALKSKQITRLAKSA